MKLADYTPASEIDTDRLYFELAKKYEQISYSLTVNSLDVGFCFTNADVSERLLKYDQVYFFKFYLLLTNKISTLGFCVRWDGKAGETFMQEMMKELDIDSNQFYEALYTLENDGLIVILKYKYCEFISTPASIASYELFFKIKTYEKLKLFATRKDKVSQSEIIPDEATALATVDEDAKTRKGRKKKACPNIRTTVRFLPSKYAEWIDFCSKSSKDNCDILSDALTHFIETHSAKTLDIPKLPRAVPLEQHTIRVNKVIHNQFIEFLVDHTAEGYKRHEIFTAVIDEYMKACK